MAPELGVAGEPEDFRRGVGVVFVGSGGGGGGGAGLREEVEDLGVAGLRWNPMAALTRPATIVSARGASLAGSGGFRPSNTKWAARIAPRTWALFLVRVLLLVLLLLVGALTNSAHSMLSVYSELTLCVV